MLKLAPILTLLFAAACQQATTRDETTRDETNKRSFRFDYQTTVSDFPEGAERVRIWLPLATSDETQTISDVHIDAPVAHRIGTETEYGNQSVYLELEAPLPASVPITLSLNVKRREVSSVETLAGAPRRTRLLEGDLKAPINEEAKARAVRATEGRSTTIEQAQGIYDQVLADVNYDKSGSGWGQGNLEFVCAKGRGNCSDFHTLFIAMARSEEIPAVFEIGFPLPADKTEGTIGGYHCWAWFEDEAGRWRPVDASEADKNPAMADYFFGTLCANRVGFTHGRDLRLDPPQSGEPLNFFVYPHVEVDGQAGVARVENEFRFREL